MADPSICAKAPPFSDVLALDNLRAILQVGS